MTTGSTRPSVSRPDALSPAALADARQHQPTRGLVGLAIVLPLTAVLSVGADGPTRSLTLLAPIIAFALPIIAMIAFWWDDWPGSKLARPWWGLTDTGIVVIGGLALTLLGQLVVNGTDLAGVFAPGPGHPGSYPDTVPLAGGIFTIMLQLTLVSEYWPLRPLLGRLPSGPVAVVLAWLLGLLAWLLAVRSHAIQPENYGAWLTSIGCWQMLFYLALRGWPFARINRRWLRLLIANVVVIGFGWAGYLFFADALGLSPGEVTAISGTGVGCVLLVCMLFEAWPAIRLDSRPLGRTLVVGTVVTLTALLVWLLPMLARAIGVSAAQQWNWTTHVTLNALATMVILHVAVGRRWPSRASLPE